MAQERIRNEIPEFYEAIFPFISSLPDFRPPETLEQMRLMGSTMKSQDNWGVVENEIEAASREGEEGEEDLTLIQAIFSGDLETMESFLEEDLEDFILTYRALIWLASKVAPEETIIPLLVSQNQADLLPESFDIAEAIKWIRDREMARYLRERDSDAIEINYDLFIEWAENGELGNVLWGLEDARIDPSVQQNYAIRRAAARGHLEIVRELMKDNRVNPSALDNKAIQGAA